MKNIFTILFVSVLMIACNDSTDKGKDIAIDSSDTDSPLMDAINVRDSAGKVIEAAKDTAKKVIKDVNGVIKP